MTDADHSTDPGSDEAVAPVQGQPGTTGDQRSESHPADPHASEEAVEEADELGSGDAGGI